MTSGREDTISKSIGKRKWVYIVKASESYWLYLNSNIELKEKRLI